MSKGNKTNHSINNGCFKQGVIPWNKNKKGYTTSRKGQSHSVETKNKISLKAIERLKNPENNPNYIDGRSLEENYNSIKYKNYMKTPSGMKANHRRNSKRRELGNEEVNEPFKGSVGHHVTIDYVVNVPSFLNKGYHNVRTGKNMDEKNYFILNYLFLIYGK